MNLAAEEKIDEHFPLAAPPAIGFVFSNDRLPETRIRVPDFKKQAFIGASAWLSSTARWGCGYRCDGTASGLPVGRFNTPDRITPSNAKVIPANWNKYAYVSGDPINKRDPRGTCSPDDDPPCYSATGTASSDDSWSWGDPLDDAFWASLSGPDPAADPAAVAECLPGCMIDNAVPSLGQALSQASQWLTSNAQQYMKSASDMALYALKNIPTCASDFETAGSLAAGLDPATVFNELYGNISANGIGGVATAVNGTPISSGFVPSFGMIGWPFINPDAQVVPNLFFGSSGVATGYTVLVNANTFAGNGVLGNNYINAAVLLHELGHILNDLLPGSSAILNDANNSNQSMANTAKIFKDCNLN